MGKFTDRFKLYKPDVGETNWGEKVNQNFDIIDERLNVTISKIDKPEVVFNRKVYDASNNFNGFISDYLGGYSTIEDGKLCLYGSEGELFKACHVEVVSPKYVELNTNIVHHEGYGYGIMVLFYYEGLSEKGVAIFKNPEIDRWMIMYPTIGELSAVIYLDEPPTSVNLSMRIADGKVFAKVNDIEFDFDAEIVGDVYLVVSLIAGKEEGVIEPLKFFEVLSYKIEYDEIVAPVYLIGRPVYEVISRDLVLEPSNTYTRIYKAYGYGIARIMITDYKAWLEHVVRCDGVESARLGYGYPNEVIVMFRNTLEILVAPRDYETYANDLTMMYIGNLLKVDRTIKEITL